MGRPPRITEPGLAYHVLNRRVMRLPLFLKDEDYLAFERVLAESLARPDAPRLLAWCLMPNHWHLVVHAGHQTDLSAWMQWVTVTHTHRWHAHTHTTGEGPLYQGRFKSFPTQTDDHFLTACRYVEANAKRAHLVKRAEQWRWGSLWTRRRSGSELKPWAQRWPVSRPRNWLAKVNGSMDEESLAAVRRSVTRGVPLGAESWRVRIAHRLGLDITLRPRGHPRKETEKSS
ncbi:MAG TPA: transposase [Phycisphaerae bacterium]|nr:transposase [Phycisphaerae bacterium]